MKREALKLLFTTTFVQHLSAFYRTLSLRLTHWDQLGDCPRILRNADWIKPVSSDLSRLMFSLLAGLLTTDKTAGKLTNGSRVRFLSLGEQVRNQQRYYISHAPIKSQTPFRRLSYISLIQNAGQVTVVVILEIIQHFPNPAVFHCNCSQPFIFCCELENWFRWPYAELTEQNKGYSWQLLSKMVELVYPQDETTCLEPFLSSKKHF